MIERGHGHARGRLLPALALSTLLAGGGLAVAFVAYSSPVASHSSPGGNVGGWRESPVPPPVEPAFVPPNPRLLGRPRDVSWYAPVRRPAAVRAAPDPSAPGVAALATRTPEGTENIVLVLGRARGGDGRLWVHVRLAVHPNSRTGWVPRAALGGYSAVHTRLVVDIERLTATLYREGRAVFRARIGVGRSESPTPKGEFYIRNKLTRYATPFYGPLAFGTSARSSVITDWPAGGFIGIHGTNRPDLLPGRVSHGCIRLRNRDILELGRLMAVGTPVTIR
jgi:hypothetical protein